MFGKKKKRQVLKIEKGQWAQIWESFKQNKLAMISMVVLLLIVLGALSADLFMDYQIWGSPAPIS